MSQLCLLSFLSSSILSTHLLFVSLSRTFPQSPSVSLSVLLRLSQAQFLLLLHIITQSCYAICLSVSLMLFADVFLSFTFISSSVRVMSSLTHKCTHTQTPLLCVCVRCSRDAWPVVESCISTCRWETVIAS